MESTPPHFTSEVKRFASPRSVNRRLAPELRSRSQVSNPKCVYYQITSNRVEFFTEEKMRIEHFKIPFSSRFPGFSSSLLNE